jgi:hypothetical protein
MTVPTHALRIGTPKGEMRRFGDEHTMRNWAHVLDALGAPWELRHVSDIHGQGWKGTPILKSRRLI